MPVTRYMQEQRKFNHPVKQPKQVKENEMRWISDESIWNEITNEIMEIVIAIQF